MICNLARKIAQGRFSF